MTSNRRDFDDHAFDFEALISEPSPRNDTALTQWAKGSVPPGRPTPPPANRSHPAPPPIAVRPLSAPSGSSAVSGRPRGQVLSWTALTLAIVMSALIGGGVYAALNAIDVTAADSLGTAAHLLTLPVVGLVGLVVTLVLAVAALFHARPRLVATVALILAILLPVVSAVVGVKFGAEALVRHVHDQAGVVGSAADYVIGLLSQHGVDVGPLRALIHWVLG